MSRQVLARSQAMTAQFQGFWQSEIQMILQAGPVLPVLSGFEQYREAKAPGKFRRHAGSFCFLTRSGIHRKPSRPPWYATIRAWSAAPGSRPEAVLLQNWAQQVARKGAAFAGLRAGRLYDTLPNDLVDLSRRIIFQESGRLYAPAQLRVWTAQMLVMALAVALSRDGGDSSIPGPAHSWRSSRTGRHLSLSNRWPVFLAERSASRTG
jgi:hypothetical protein